MNMEIFKELTHEAKVILSIVGGAAIAIAGNQELLTVLLTRPFLDAIPVVLPKLVASGALSGALYNMAPKKE